MASNDRKLIAVIGATGKQRGAVVRALATAAIRDVKDAGIKHFIVRDRGRVEAIRDFSRAA
jgi:uncharacterized protein YbjT (DUF2867 family)